ncbi:hypothetical protein DPMN_052746 [Dreissena polymorpha]|uniref:Uncharacterized protein n=1 Tax=Dreissena polymorpha TaxID=45954 RepID=A0A9D4CLF7_DREPO|nr:hypothetical protein DPMN_052746 [Dreissena polymorpha]
MPSLPVMFILGAVILVLMIAGLLQTRRRVFFEGRELKTCNVSSSHYCTGCGWTMDEEYRQNIQNREYPIRLSNTVELIEIIQDE